MGQKRHYFQTLYYETPCISLSPLRCVRDQASHEGGHRGRDEGERVQAGQQHPPHPDGQGVAGGRDEGAQVHLVTVNSVVVNTIQAELDTLTENDAF